MGGGGRAGYGRPCGPLQEAHSFCCSCGVVTGVTSSRACISVDGSGTACRLGWGCGDKETGRGLWREQERDVWELTSGRDAHAAETKDWTLGCLRSGVTVRGDSSRLPSARVCGFSADILSLRGQKYRPGIQSTPASSDRDADLNQEAAGITSQSP